MKAVADSAVHAASEHGDMTSEVMSRVTRLR